MHPLPATPSEFPRTAYRLLVWLIEGCAQVPRWQGTTLRFCDARTLDWCAGCGRGREVLAHQIGSRYCRRCIRVILRRHLLAEYHPSSSIQES